MKAVDGRSALRMARRDAAYLERVLDVSGFQIWNYFPLGARRPGDGSTVYSASRFSELSITEYLNTFYDTGNEFTQ